MWASTSSRAATALGEPVISVCYWGNYRSGTNGDEIIENHVVQSGFPTVTLQDGQGLENGCGVFVKQ